MTAFKRKCPKCGYVHYPFQDHGSGYKPNGGRQAKSIKKPNKDLFKE